MSRVMQDDKATLDDYMEVAYASYESRKRPPMLRVSTPDYRYGSVAMLDTAYMDDIAKTFDSDLLLLPCSIREFLITPWTEDTNLSELVKSARKSSPRDRNLSSPDTSSATTKIRRNWN